MRAVLAAHARARAGRGHEPGIDMGATQSLFEDLKLMFGFTVTRSRRRRLDERRLLERPAPAAVETVEYGDLDGMGDLKRNN